MKNYLFLIVILLFNAQLMGCATSALWKERQYRDTSEAALPAELYIRKNEGPTVDREIHLLFKQNRDITAKYCDDMPAVDQQGVQHLYIKGHLASSDRQLDLSRIDNSPLHHVFKITDITADVEFADATDSDKIEVAAKILWPEAGIEYVDSRTIHQYFYYRKPDKIEYAKYKDYENEHRYPYPVFYGEPFREKIFEYMYKFGNKEIDPRLGENPFLYASQVVYVRSDGKYTSKPTEQDSIVGVILPVQYPFARGDAPYGIKVSYATDQTGNTIGKHLGSANNLIVSQTRLCESAPPTFPPDLDSSAYLYYPVSLHFSKPVRRRLFPDLITVLLTPFAVVFDVVTIPIEAGFYFLAIMGGK